VKHADTFVRFGIAAALVVAVFLEAGPWTAVAVATLFVYNAVLTLSLNNTATAVLSKLQELE
jgi:hypothetical protein